MKIKLLLSLPVVLAAGIASASTDPAAVAKAGTLLKTADEKLASAQTLHAVYTETDEYPGEYKDLRQVGTLTLSRPGNVSLEIVRARRVKASDPWKDSGNTTLRISDGQKSYNVFFHAHSTQVRSQDATANLKLEEAPLLGGFLAGSRSPAAAFAAADQSGDLSSVEVDGSRIKFKAGELERAVEVGSDGLIHRLVVHSDRGDVTRTWTLNSITLDQPVAASTFHYSVPKDAIPFPPGERSMGIANGEIAPNFEVQSSENKPLKLSDFKGKVTVLEFWATWCWPCNQSIPETERLVSKYRAQGVEGFLVSIKDNRNGFDAWVKKHPQFRDLKFAFDDPTNGQAYANFLHPQNPTLYAIGRDGRVLLKTEGYTGPNPEVEKAIQAAL